MKRPGKPSPLAVLVWGLASAVVLCGCPEGDTIVDSGRATSPSTSAAAQLISIEGSVTYRRGSQTGPATLGPLYVGDALETQENGKARVKLEGGREIEIGPDASFVLERGDQGLVLNVARGLVLLRGGADTGTPDAAVSLSVLTPFGLTRVGQAEVSVDVGKDGAKVGVTVGSIEWISRDGKAVTVRESAEIDAQGRLVVKTLKPVLITVYANKGRAEVKKNGAKNWAPVSTKKPTPVEEGDGVRVRGGKASIDAEGAGSKLSLGRDGEAVIVGAAVSDEQENTTLTLQKGELSAQLPMKKKSRLSVGGVTFVSDLGGQLAIVKTRSGFELTAIAGDVRVERPGAEPTTVPGGKLAHITPKGVSISTDPREVVTLPSKQNLHVFHPGIARVALTWEGAEDQAFRVTVAQDAQFAAPLLSGILRQRYVNVPAPARGALFWKIEDESGKPIDSGSAQFSPEPRATDLERQRNVVGDGSEKTTIYFQDKPPSVTFTYDPDTEAVQYRLWVYRDGQLDKPLVELMSKEEQAVLPAGALSEGKYLWSVTPLGKKGEELRGGRMNKLQIVYDNAVLKLLISSPQNGAPGGSRVPVRGVAPVGSRVTLNGRPLELDDNSRFESVAAPLGRGVLVFRLFQGAVESVTVRTVRRGN